MYFDNKTRKALDMSAFLVLLRIGWAAYPSYQVPKKGAQGAFPARQLLTYSS